MRAHPLLLLTVAAVPCAMGARAQTTWYVDVANPAPGSGTPADPYSSLQDALSRPSTVDGDTLLVAPGIYFESIDFLGKDVAVFAPGGPGVTAIDASFLGRGVRFVSGEGPGAVLDGFTVTHGVAPDQTIDTGGGGIQVIGASPTLHGLVVRENRAMRGAGISFANSTATLSDSHVHHNSFSLQYGSVRGGLGIYVACDASPLITRTQITDNVLVDSAYGDERGGGALGGGTYVECRFARNDARYGGGAALVPAGCSATFVDCTFEDNGALQCIQGGGVHGGTLSGCLLRGNRASEAGGGAYGALIANSTIEDNVAGPGQHANGGGLAYGSATDCLIRRNLARSAPGNLFPARGGGASSSALVRCTVAENTTRRGSGGGADGCTLEDCDVVGNVAEQSGGQGVVGLGGGLHASQATRCVLRENRGDRGAACADSSLSQCTVLLNVATTGGAVHARFGNHVVANSILWDDAPAELATEGGGTLTVDWSDVRGGAAGPGNLDLDPRFFGPRAGDVHLKSGSPCIDAGDPAAPPDPDGSRLDVGARTFDPAWLGEPGTWCTGKTNSQGCVPAIGWSGVPAATGPDDFHVRGSGFLNQKSGLFAWSRGAQTLPFQGGTLCVRPPIVRTPIQNSGGNPWPPSDCSGAYDFFFGQAYRASVGIAPGDTVYAQWFARDPAAADGSGVSLSDAIEFTARP